MNPHYLSGELTRAAKFEFIRLPIEEKKHYKGVPQVDISMLKRIDHFHAQPANSLDHSRYVNYPTESPEDFLNGVPIYNVQQTETIMPSNANNSLFMNHANTLSTRQIEAPKQSIVGQTLLK